MNPQTITLAEKIASTEAPLAGEDNPYLLLAHEIIAKVRVTGFVPIDPTVAADAFDDEDVAVLKEALFAYAQTHANHESRGTAYWGLAALHETALLDRFRELLRLEASRPELDETVLWQLMIALDNLGEDILRPLGKEAVEQCGDRWATAKLYLGRCGLHQE